MFDRTTWLMNPAPRHTSVTVTEHRAPTDESVKLLKEMQEKASAALIGAVHVNDTALDAVLQLEEDLASDAVLFRVVFSLNGTKMTVSGSMRSIDVTSAEVALDKIKSAIVGKLATEILRTSMTPEIIRRIQRIN